MLLPPAEAKHHYSGSVTRHVRSQRLPRFGRRVFEVYLPGKWLLVHWQARTAYWCLAVGNRTPHKQEPHSFYPRPEETRVKRRQPPAGAGAIMPALAATSVTLAKFTLLREFLTATQYDDGAPRTPGDLALRNRGVAFEVTLYDPDAGLRLPVRAATLDDVLALAEKLLGVESAPWEVDRYLTEQLGKKKGRKKAS